MLFKPTTYMNLSGVAVESVLRHNKVDIENIYVIHDDLEIKRGVVRMQNTPGVHGHNGLRSINSHVGVGYWKIRIGIGRPADNNIHEYVLETMPPKDLMLFGDIGTRIADVLHLLFEHSKQNFLDCVNNVVRPDDAA